MKVCIIFLLLGVVNMTLAQQKLNTTKIDSILKTKGEFKQEERVYEVNFPRTDLKVNIGGVITNAAMGITSYAAFTKKDNDTMIMGELALTEGQVSYVMNATLNNGLEVSALHNHYLGDSPRIMYLHYSGMGDEGSLSVSALRVFKAINESKGMLFPTIHLDPAKTTLNTSKIDELIGYSGTLNDGVYSIKIGRNKDSHLMGEENELNFVGSDDEAVASGEFQMLEREVQGVLKALCNANINVVALHNHELDQPTYYAHFWGIGTVQALAKGLRTALDSERDLEG